MSKQRIPPFSPTPSFIAKLGVRTMFPFPELPKKHANFTPATYTSNLQPLCRLFHIEFTRNFEISCKTARYLLHHI